MNTLETIEVEITVELGATIMPIHHLLRMGRGAVIELDTTERDPMRVYANNTLIAHGDVKVDEGHLSVEITENTAEGIAPDFQSQGFIRPAKVSLIEQGCFRNCLASPRSAKEYSVPTNGAGSGESPFSIDMAPGSLAQGEVLQELGTGLYINNLWYLNFSDRPACRMTGMTRFATLWVENGEIVAPVNVMRFDESIYRVLGQNLLGLTQERDLILDSETYGGRSTRSGRLPGAIVDEFAFTL